MRRILAFALAIGVSAALFWMMHYLTSTAQHEIDAAPDYRSVEFVRVERSEEIRTRERSRPEPPPPEEPPPPPPELTVQSTAPAERPSSAASFDLPKLDIPLGMTGGPFLGQLAAAGSAVDGTGNAELVPLVRLAPQYPRQAARMGISGWVRLRVVVNPDGTVRDARAIDAEPRGLFEAAAVTAAMRGKFRPRIVDGEAVESEGEYTVRFSLGDQP